MPTKAELITLKVLGEPLDNGDNFAIDFPPTEGDAVRYYNWLLGKEKGGKKNAKLNDAKKNALKGVISKKIISYWKSNFDLQDKDLKTPKHVGKIVNEAIQRMEKIKGDTRKISASEKDDSIWIAQRKSFAKVIDAKKNESVIENFDSLPVSDQMSVSDEMSVSDQNDADPKDKDFEVETETETEDEEDTEKSKYNTREFPGMIAAIIRSGISDEMITDVLNNYLVDTKVTDEKEYFCADKIRRLRMKHLQKLTAEHDKKTVRKKVIGIDGKKSRIKLPKGKFKMRVDKVSVTCQCSRGFIGFFSPKNGTGLETARHLTMLLEKIQSLDTLQGVAADGTASNTGKFNGAIRLLEVALRRPLQWQICILHFEELIFRYLFIEIGKYS